ncbi:hypothetical protein HDK77DRAFT_447106 [Phyllosticta capitalensis]|uniref:Uncharacterized protein n=1 Tax=Phyllosticta capitalensis TaxID=121624 RepID=A0ABR1YHE9_9PEZI
MSLLCVTGLVGWSTLLCIVWVGYGPVGLSWLLASIRGIPAQARLCKRGQVGSFSRFVPLKSIKFLYSVTIITLLAPASSTLSVSVACQKAKRNNMDFSYGFELDTSVPRMRTSRVLY